MGFFIFQFDYDTVDVEFIKGFRPLLGFFIFQFDYDTVDVEFIKGFRPLLGFFIFQYLKTISLCNLATVSVPYWGSLYFNGDDQGLGKTKQIVSVPYWGSLYFNNLTNCKTKKKYAFPSPIGVLYISMNSQLKFSAEFANVSVPYWGSLYFNNIETGELFHFSNIVSVPYWGSLYFNND